MLFSSLQTKKETEEKNYYSTNPAYYDSKKDVFDLDVPKLEASYRWLDDFGWI